MEKLKEFARTNGILKEAPEKPDFDPSADQNHAIVYWYDANKVHFSKVFTPSSDPKEDKLKYV